MINHVSMYYTLGLQWWRTKIAVISPSPNHNFQSSITNLVVVVEHQVRSIKFHVMNLFNLTTCVVFSDLSHTPDLYC